MSFTLDDYSIKRPFLYHLACQDNIERIRLTRRIVSSASLLIAAGREMDLRAHRSTTLTLTVDGQQVLLRDQAPLEARHIEFADGWTLGDLVEYLNRHVFFWPGKAKWLKENGKAHFQHYAAENPAMIRVAVDSLRGRNRGQTFLFSKYNSGAPRPYFGRPSPRGPDTFLPADRCDFSPSRVVEVTFVESVILPDDTALSDHPSGPWTPLFTT